MPSIRKLHRFFQDRSFLADLLALAGMLGFFFMLWMLAHSQASVLDEGLYLYKGWLFSTGKYRPFQAYGPWTNQMPLAFFIPGWLEQLFGPGLRTGRLMAVALGILMLPALWLTARRLAGSWIAAGLVLAVALNPAAARMFAMAASQGLVACLLAWSMWFSLGNDRRSWQSLAGGLLAGSAVMVRINLLPLLPLLGLYVLWARGWKAMLWSIGGMLAIFGGMHIIFWPDILKLWAKWLPFGFLKSWFPPQNTPTWTPDNPLEFRIASFFLAFRYHFAALAGSLAAWVFWPSKNRLSPEIRKIAGFLSILLLALILLHAWAALGNEYCVFCFPTYTAFYSGLGLLLAAVTLPYWDLNPPAWRKWTGALAFLGLLAGMAYSAESAASSMLGDLFYKRLLSLPIPGFKGALVWQILANKFHLEYERMFDNLHTWFPVFVALVFGLLVFAAARAFYRPAWGAGIVVLVLAGSLFSPLPVLAGDYNTYDCNVDVIPGYEATGGLLARSIPPGSKVFWAGYSPVPLLYLPDVKIYPPQLHGAYSFRISPNDDALEKYGWWNEHLAEKWLSEADYVLAEQKNLGRNDWLGAPGRLEKFELVARGAPQTCDVVPASGEVQDASAMFLYRRK